MKFDFRLSGEDLLNAEALARKKSKSVGLLAKELLLIEIQKEGSRNE